MGLAALACVATVAAPARARDDLAGDGAADDAGDGADTPLWRQLAADGAIAMIRHARAPGTGDPPGFDLGSCATQRNLSPEGRAQAVGLGKLFRARNVPVVRVLSSRWCRCLDTARLAFGEATPFPLLDSFFEDRAQGPAQTDALRAWLLANTVSGTTVLVTHQVNVTALTGIFPREGDIVVLRPQAGTLAVAGHIRNPVPSVG